MTSIHVAAAPISWGVCEVPGWGHQIGVDRVLREMEQLGFDATEFGPEGFLPQNPHAKADTLADHSLKAVGGFVPAVLHDPDHDPLPGIQRELAGYESARAGTLVLAAATGIDGYDAARPRLDGAGWATVFGNIDRILDAAAAVGVKVALHPHVGTMVEAQDDVDRLLAGTGLDICFDTGHMFIGGIDPVAFARDHADRISHAHLKDVSLAHARSVRSGEEKYYDAVVDGMYRPLGGGDIDIAGIVHSLLTAGFDGWFVLEQDTVIAAEDAEPIDDVRKSLNYLKRIAEDVA